MSDAPAPRVALVTGANKGIGLEIARGLGRAGLHVLIGARDPDRGQAAAHQLRAEGTRAEAVMLDVTSAQSLASAAEEIEARHGSLDVLVNNAGVMLDWGPVPSIVPMDLTRATFETNVFGVIATTQAMLPLLHRSQAGRIVNLSSGLGSIGWTSDPKHPYAGFVLLAYNASKAAVNMVTVQFANELRGTGIKVNAADPGYCATDINGHSGPRSAAEGAATPIRLALLPVDGPTGSFFNDDGTVPW